MSKKRTPPAPHTLIASIAGLEAALAQYVDRSLKLIRRKAKQDREAAELKQRHAKENEDDEREVIGLENGIAVYCVGNRAALLPDEGESKSRDFGCAVIGFRLHPFAVEKIVARDTWEAIADRIEAAPWGEPYVVTKTAIDKEALLKDRAALTPAQLAQAGICFARGETFFIDPASDLLEAARKPAQAESEAA